MAMPPNAVTLKPFLAPLLLRRVDATPAASLLAALVAEAQAAIVSKGAMTRTNVTPSSVQAAGGVSVQTIEYVEKSPPAWAPLSGLEDIKHQLVVVATKGDLAAICSSDPGLRNKLGAGLVAARPVNRATIEQAFVGTQASAMWLVGVHTPTDSRPNAKTLMGTALEYALDPLGDQSFYYSAVRSRIPWQAAGGGPANVLVGAAPGSGRIWVKRPQNWADFLVELEAVLDLLATPPPASLKFGALAQAVASLAGVSDAYALTLIPPELLADEDITPEEREAANMWAYEAQFDVRPGAGASLEASVRLGAVDLGDVSLAVAMAEDRIQLAPAWLSDPGGVDALREQCLAYLADTNWTKIYYETGHAVSQGRCYQSAYRDQPFDWRFEPFANYEVTAEKPTPEASQTLADAIGWRNGNGVRDNSLFAYTLDRFGQQGWLASDDGSMEFADFVHIADDDVVTLIHAKAAKSDNPNRQVSVSSYEVVVGQAVKNLRHLERATLATELEKGKDKLISKAVWRDGVRQQDRTGIIARANALPASYRRRVIVLQPQLTQQEHDLCLAPGAARGRAIRMKQLNTLMLAARLSAAAVGAEFVGWAAS